MAGKLAKLVSNSFRLATSDLANQYALPVKGMTGAVVSRYAAAKSRRLNRRIVDQMAIKQDDYIFEIGYGRGDAIGMCFEKVRNGKGMVFGVERSGYMDEVTRRRFILEIVENGKIRIDSAIDLRNLPYPTDIFDHVFHVDVFYFLPPDQLVEINREIWRVLKPGASFVCGLQFSRLNTLTETNLLDKSQWDPFRFLCSLEAAEFENVGIEYLKDSEIGEFQVISGRKPENRRIEEEEPDELWRKLEMDIKQERMAISMMQNRRNVEE